VSRTSILLAAASGAVLGFALTAGLLRRQRVALSTARRQATHDDLTGLPNRRAFITHLRRIRRHRAQVSLLLLDLDRFKTVNDTHGHTAGDALLQAVAARLSALPPPVRLVARLSGDEFVLVVAGGAQAAVAAASAARTAIAGTPFTLGTTSVAVTPSVGVAVWRARLSVAQVLHHADQAMYEAKRTGRGIGLHRGHPPATITARPTNRVRDGQRPDTTFPPTSPDDLNR
jgi:diguanylate cyclase (GGDEF)-like protein